MLKPNEDKNRLGAKADWRSVWADVSDTEWCSPRKTGAEIAMGGDKKLKEQ